MITILVVDDDRNLRQEVCEILQLNDYVTIESTNGRQAIFEILANRPDLILCDVQMPGMNGFELLRQLKCDTEFASIPFVFLSGIASPEGLQKARDHGANAFVSKPFSIDTLLMTLSTVLKGTHPEAKH